MGLLLLATGAPSPAHGAETGAELAERVCRDCHGERGRSERPDIPSIGGFGEYAIMDLIETYGRRQGSAARALRERGLSPLGL